MLVVHQRSQIVRQIDEGLLHFQDQSQYGVPEQRPARAQVKTAQRSQESDAGRGDHSKHIPVSRRRNIIQGMERRV